MPGPILPPFPNNVRTYPLVAIDFDFLKAGDPSEIERLWEAATSIGFWYLKNHGASQEVDSIFDLGPEVMALPLEEKMKFHQTDGGPLFGFAFIYRNAGTIAVDATGDPSPADSFTVSKDDALAFPQVVHATYPAVVLAAMQTTLRPFVHKYMEVNSIILRIFNDKLGLPDGMLERLHSDEELSLSIIKLVRIQPMPEQMATDKKMLGAHADLGSLSFLHNRLGGLQILPPGHTEWSYVKPLPGHAICNVGDALAIFSGGILQSGMHRVVRAPGDQGEHERWSVMFFTRPDNSSVLCPFIEDSSLIADAVKKHPDSNFNTGQTAAEWFVSRIQKRKPKNRKGPERWAASNGTKHRTET